MIENESDDKKDGGRRMDKAVLINLLTKVNSSDQPRGSSPEVEGTNGSQPTRLDRTNLQEKQVPEGT
jgi:hypothetical protein